MNIPEKISELLVEYITNNIDKTEEEVEVIQYGIQVILINLFKMIILFLTAYLLNVFTYTLIAFVSFGMLRAFASGVHADSSIKCIILNYIVFLGNVFFSLSFSLNRITAAAILVISLISYIAYAPADTEERPLVSKKLRKQSKIRAIIAVLSLGAISIVISNPVYRSLIIFAILEEAFFITPFAYMIFRKSYKNYENVEL